MPSMVMSLPNHELILLCRGFGFWAGAVPWSHVIVALSHHSGRISNIDLSCVLGWISFSGTVAQRTMG